jgi:hypothetical protein
MDIELTACIRSSSVLSYSMIYSPKFETGLVGFSDLIGGYFQLTNPEWKSGF